MCRFGMMRMWMGALGYRSLNASTESSSYSMSAGVCRATMRQKMQSITKPPRSPCYNTASPGPNFESTQRSSRDGNVSEVQAEDPEERQPREARLHVVPQDLPPSSVQQSLIGSSHPTARRHDTRSFVTHAAAAPLTASICAAPWRARR